MLGSPEHEVPAGESQEAEEAIARLSRQQVREVRGSQVDFVELFQSSPATTLVRQRGLRTPPPHETFTEQAGWNVVNKDHRRRFRAFLEKQRPGTVHIRLPPRDRQGSETSEAVMSGFALEIVQEQLRQGRCFVLDAPEDLPLWNLEAWTQVLTLPQVSIRRLAAENKRVISNFTWDSGQPSLSDGPYEVASKDFDNDEEYGNYHISEERDEEVLARRLLEQGDFSQASCLKLLRTITWPSTSRRTRRQCVDEAAEVHLLGQYSGTPRAT